jgi:aminoglycoside phosphotransferase (APT) family kinase protein
LIPTFVGDGGFDLEGFERWLNVHMPDAAGLHLTSSHEVKGGRSKKTVLLTQSGCASLPQHLVLRSDLNAALTGTTVTSEYELLRRLHDAGVRVPRPLYMSADGSSPIGSPFILMERLPGRTQGDLFNAPADRNVVLQLAEQLAYLHRQPPADFADCDGVRTTAVNAADLGVELDKLRTDIQTYGDGSAIEVMACDWLRAHLDDAEPCFAVVHGDPGFHNILVHDGHLSGVLDWELAHIGHPAEDLGYCRCAVEGALGWGEFLSRYRASGAPWLSDAAIDFYTLWVIVRFHALAVRVRSGVVSGAVPGLDLTLTSLVFPPNLLRLMARYLKQFGG